MFFTILVGNCKAERAYVETTLGYGILAAVAVSGNPHTMKKPLRSSEDTADETSISLPVK
jgi:hypothetical protein